MIKEFFSCTVLEELIFYLVSCLKLVSYVMNDNVVSGEFNM